MRKPQIQILALPILALLSACGGGGGTGNPSLPPVPVTTATPSPTPSPVTVQGSVVQIGPQAYGPTAAPIGPLANATVVIGSTLVTGPTAPPSAPAGDAILHTDASGNYSGTAPSGLVAPSSQTFPMPPDNLLNLTEPATGLYVSVYASGADGLSAGSLLPLHGFASVTNGKVQTLHVSSASTDEANWLAQVNSDRSANGAGNVYFDEYAMEAARLHANEQAAMQTGACHYNAQNVGPASRYLSMNGIGVNAENVADVGTNNFSTAQAWQWAETSFMSEKSTNGGHYTNLVNSSHIWVGLGIATSAWPPAGGTNPTWYAMDQEFVNFDASSTAAIVGYTNTSCPSGIVVNNS